jgi:hypothetical protein
MLVWLIRNGVRSYCFHGLVAAATSSLFNVWLLCMLLAVEFRQVFGALFIIKATVIDHYQFEAVFLK